MLANNQLPNHNNQIIINNQFTNNQTAGAKRFGYWLLILRQCSASIPSIVEGLMFGICLMIGIWLLVISTEASGSPQRIISTMPSITEMLYALDLEDRVVGVTSNCNYPPQVKEKEKIGGFFLNLEKIVSLKPDLIVMLEDAQEKDVKRFKDFGLPVFTVNPKTVDDVMAELLNLGKVTDSEEKAQLVVNRMKERIQAIKSQNSGIVVEKNALVIVGYNPLIVAGGGTFINSILDCAGVENIASQTKAAYPQYSFEKLVNDNPQYIIIPEGLVKKEEIEKDKRWRSLEAVRTGQILFIDADILSRPGPRVVETIDIIAGFVYNQDVYGKKAQ